MRYFHANGEVYCGDCARVHPEYRTKDPSVWSANSTSCNACITCDPSGHQEDLRWRRHLEKHCVETNYDVYMHMRRVKQQGTDLHLDTLMPFVSAMKCVGVSTPSLSKHPGKESLKRYGLWDPDTRIGRLGLGDALLFGSGGSGDSAGANLLDCIFAEDVSTNDMYNFLALNGIIPSMKKHKAARVWKPLKARYTNYLVEYSNGEFGWVDRNDDDDREGRGGRGDRERLKITQPVWYTTPLSMLLPRRYVKAMMGKPPVWQRKEIGMVNKGKSDVSKKSKTRVKSDLVQRLKSSESVEHYTPNEIVYMARRVMKGIDLDPCSCIEANKEHKIRTIYSKGSNGLENPWYGNVWLNPPFGWIYRGNKRVPQVSVWIDRLISEWKSGNVKQGIMLVNANTGAGWFEPLWDHPLCFVRGRINFWYVKNGVKTVGTQPTHYNVLVGIGVSENRFSKVFEKIGQVIL